MRSVAAPRKLQVEARQPEVDASQVEAAALDLAIVRGGTRAQSSTPAAFEVIANRFLLRAILDVLTPKQRAELLARLEP